MGKTAVVTGGSSGIGLAAAVRLAADGAYVFITGRRKAEHEAAVETIGLWQPPSPGEIANLDRPRPPLRRRPRARARASTCCSPTRAPPRFATLEQTTADHLDRIFAVNVRGTLFTVQKALPLLNDGASIILNSSVRADDGVEAFGAYAASKAALRSYTRTWANELKGRGIRVNAIAPGTIDTPAPSPAWSARNRHPPSWPNVAAAIPLGRVGRADEVASVVSFLASADSSFILGTNLHIDGGENQI